MTKGNERADKTTRPIIELKETNVKAAAKKVARTNKALESISTIEKQMIEQNDLLLSIKRSLEQISDYLHTEQWKS